MIFFTIKSKFKIFFFFFFFWGGGGLELVIFLQRIQILKEIFLGGRGRGGGGVAGEGGGS